ncbi:vitamin K epoxide reductase family protein [Ktedonobacteria bacterium brp13]|nr:vitamin K epoxide reductase family protein [Ktedonobacteria bacterium brp13]
MTYFQRFWAQISLLVLSLIGVGVSIYLDVAHYEKAPVACSNSGIINCERVLNSVYGSIPHTNIPISIPGLLFFLAFACLALLSWLVWPERKILVIGEVVLAALGLLTAFYLVFVELVYLHNICAWCTSLHIIIFISLLIAVYQLLQLNVYEDDELEYEDDEAIAPVSTHRIQN